MSDRDGRRAASVLVALAAAAFAQAPGAVELYRWVDADGAVFFSDKPPVDVPPEHYEGPRPKTVRQALEEESAARREAAVAERLARQRAARERATARDTPAEQARAPADDIEINSPYDCDQARRFYDHYSTIDRPQYRQTPEGGFRRVTPEELADQVRQWEEAVRLLCPAPPPGADS